MTLWEIDSFKREGFISRALTLSPTPSKLKSLNEDEELLYLPNEAINNGLKCANSFPLPSAVQPQPEVPLMNGPHCHRLHRDLWAPPLTAFFSACFVL